GSVAAAHLWRGGEVCLRTSIAVVPGFIYCGRLVRRGRALVLEFSMGSSNRGGDREVAGTGIDQQWLVVLANEGAGRAGSKLLPEPVRAARTRSGTGQRRGCRCQFRRPRTWGALFFRLLTAAVS